MSRLITSSKSSNGADRDSRRASTTTKDSRRVAKTTKTAKDLRRAAKKTKIAVSEGNFLEAAQTTEIINKLTGKNLLEIGSKSYFYQSWSVGKEWQTIKNSGAAGLGRLLPREERQAIEEELESIEAKFNDCLQQIAVTKFQSSPQPLSSLLKRVKELQERICNSEGVVEFTRPFEDELEGIEAKFNDYLQQTTTTPSQSFPNLSLPFSLLLKRVKELQERIYHPQGALHLTYPFFLPVFSLHLALIQAGSQNTEDRQESLNALVYDGISYLKNALDSAYKEKYDDIVLKRGGARNELGYIEDSRNNRSLTEWVSYAENKESLKALKTHLAAKLALKYVEGINFSLAWSVLDEFVKLLPATEEETEVFSLQKSAEAQIDQWKQASETTTQADSFNRSLLIPTAYDESIIPEDPDAMDYVKEYYKTVAIGMIGDLPIPGAATLSAVTGLFVSWIVGGQDDKWKKYAQAIADYIAEEIAGLETTQIENDLITAEEEFDDLCKILDSEGWEYGQPLSSELQNRFITLLYNLNELRQALYNPYSPEYTTFPYFDRLFTLHGAVLGTATTSLTTYDTYDEFRELFEKSRDYLYRAITSAVNYRYNAIEAPYSGASNHSNLYDSQSLSDLSKDRKLGGHKDRWDAFGALKNLLRVELGYVYPNRLKLIAGIHNFDSMVDQYNVFWSSRKSDHVNIEPLWDEWYEKIEDVKQKVNDKRGTIDYGYRNWSDGPGVYDNLYFAEPCYQSHFHGPRLYKSGSDDHMFIPLTDYPRAQDVIHLENFDKLDISPVYNVIVYSEENFDGKSYTFTPHPDKFKYPDLSACGFEIKSLKVVYIKSH